MSGKRYIGVIFVLCVLAAIFTSYHFTYTGDVVASKLGYLVSLVILPVFFTTISASGLIYFKPKLFGSKQKWGLLLIPIFCLIVFLGSFYWVVQYGGPH
jgi:hypothetical protein